MTPFGLNKRGTDFVSASVYIHKFYKMYMKGSRKTSTKPLKVVTSKE